MGCQPTASSTACLTLLSEGPTYKSRAGCNSWDRGNSICTVTSREGTAMHSANWFTLQRVCQKMSKLIFNWLLVKNSQLRGKLGARRAKIWSDVNELSWEILLLRYLLSVAELFIQLEVCTWKTLVGLDLNPEELHKLLILKKGKKFLSRWSHAIYKWNQIH